MKKLLWLPIMLLSGLSARAQDAEQIGGQLYQRQESREATLRHMLDRITPEAGRWGPWQLLSPFPYAGHQNSDLTSALGPEQELARHAVDGPGPDLSRTYIGKNGLELRWRPIEVRANLRVDLRVHDQQKLNSLAVCYLHTTVRAETDRIVTISSGSDDGLRVWVNGRQLYTKDVPRSLDPNADRLRLELKAGVNHVLFKIAQGHGGWEFQIGTRAALSSRQDAQLRYLLDRDFPPSPERKHYSITTLPIPEELVVEVGGLAFYGPDARPVVSTRRGDIFLIENAYQIPPLDLKFRRFASGLHEPLGAAVRKDEDGEAIYVVQRGELTRLLDLDGDDRADLYETFSDGWGVSGNYHEFAFGPKFDPDGSALVTLNVGFCGSLGKALVEHRGAALKIGRDGQVTWICDGLRSPNGIGRNLDGEWFYLDNQGDYVATNKLSHLRPGSWHGHPASLRWRADLEQSGRPPRQPPAVWFPYRKMGQSTADIVLDETGGRFGPFAGQLFVGDQLAATVMRVFLEQVNGHYQGACFPFLAGFACGVNRLAFAPDGSLFVGQTDRGWGSVGRNRYGLERVVHTGLAPFEILAMRAREQGFELEFTADLDPASAADPGSYAMLSYTYEYHSDYGAPEQDSRGLEIVGAELVGPRKVVLTVDPLRAGYVHELNATGVRSADGAPLLHGQAYYTLIEVPGRPSRRALDASARKKVLLLTQSAGFVHDVVKRPRPHILSLVEERITEWAGDDYQLSVSQDISGLDAEQLSEFDALIFYTTGELPLQGTQLAGLLRWIRSGGAFLGIHSATDTWYQQPEYQRMLGGVFDGHPWNQKVGVRVEDAGHPSTASLGERFQIEDEIYQFREFFRYPLRVLLTLDPASVELGQGRRADQEYALSWCKEYGQGRIFYTALGHRPEVWSNERFRSHLMGALDWSLNGPDQPVPAPEGALRLFEADDLSHWRSRAGGRPGWKLEQDFMEVVAGSGDLITRREFDDFLLHVEFSVPDTPPEVTGQGRGNSGVYLLGRYEIQVLDSFGLESKLGDCGAIYSQKIPDINACRPPGRWQTYDIRFRAARFDGAGRKTGQARLSVWQNGLLIHEDVELDGPTAGSLFRDEAERGPIQLQDHGNPVRYRNIWLLPEQN